MSLSRLQRDAMAQAMAGKWELADSLELLADGRRFYNGVPLLWGVYQGGRLQAFAYGHDGCDEEAEPGMIDEINADVLYVVTLNGDVLFDAEVDDAYAGPTIGASPDLTHFRATQVLAEFRDRLETPTQLSLITEAA